MRNSESQTLQDGPQPGCRLYPVSAVGWATFFGTFLGGGIIMAINYKRLGQPDASRNVLIGSIVATAALFMLIYQLPDELPIPDAVFYLPQIVGMYFLANSLQGPAIRTHINLGGSLVSTWKAVAIGAVCGVSMLGMILGVDSLATSQLGTPVEINQKDEVYFSGEATESDARALGEVLTEHGFLGGTTGATVLISRSSGHYTVSVVLVRGAWDDPKVTTYFRNLGDVLASRHFGHPLVIELRDGDLVTHKTLTIE